MTHGSDDSTARGCSLVMSENQRAFERALHESTAVADRIMRLLLMLRLNW
jgi:hypothetical protein